MPSHLSEDPKDALLDMLGGWWNRLDENRASHDPDYISQVFALYQAVGPALAKGDSPADYVEKYVLPLLKTADPGKKIPMRERRKRRRPLPEGVRERRRKGSTFIR